MIDYWNLSFSLTFSLSGVGVHHRWSYLNIDFFTVFICSRVVGGSIGLIFQLRRSCLIMHILLPFSNTFIGLGGVGRCQGNAFELLFVLSKEHQPSFEAVTLLLRFLISFSAFQLLFNTAPIVGRKT